MIHKDQPGTSEHCCMMMETFSNDPRVGIYYEPSTRDYTLKLVSSGSLQQISHCPWCGNTLPLNLTNKYYETVEKECGIKAPEWGDIDELIKEQAPDEFQSDEWWKKRNL